MEAGADGATPIDWLPDGVEPQTVKRRRRAALLVVVGLIPTACGSPGMDRPPATSLDGLSAFQREILADGVVTRPEYERAFDAAISCMRDEGVVVSDPLPQNAGRFLSYVVSLGRQQGDGNPGESLVPSESIQESCERRYLLGIVDVWNQQQTPSGREAEGMRRDYVACLQARGISVSDEATVDSIESSDEFVSDPRARPCIAQYSNRIFLFDDL